MSVVAAALRHHGMRTLLYVDDLLIACSSFEEPSSHHSGNAPRRRHCPCATQVLFRFSDPDPARPLGPHHLLHWQRSPAGSREEVLRTGASSARAALRRSQESSPCRLRPPSKFRGGSHVLLASSPLGSLSSQRSLQHARAVQAEIIPVSSSRRQPALLAQLLAQEPRELSRTLARSTIDCALRRRIEHHRLKELKACRHGLHLNVEALRGHMVKSTSTWSAFAVMQIWRMLHRANGA
jgi:hypothetical protein